MRGTLVVFPVPYRVVFKNTGVSLLETPGLGGDPYRTLRLLLVRYTMRLVLASGVFAVCCRRRCRRFRPRLRTLPLPPAVVAPAGS